MSNVQTVEAIYEAFGRGDVPSILSRLHQAVVWDYGVVDAGVPWMRPRRGHQEVMQFFQALSEVDFTRFEPTLLLENGNVVVALIDLGLLVKATGRSVNEADEVHIWRFDDQGRVTAFTHKADSYNHWAAFNNA